MSSNSSGSDKGLKLGISLCSIESCVTESSSAFKNELLKGGSSSEGLGTIPGGGGGKFGLALGTTWTWEKTPREQSKKQTGNRIKYFFMDLKTLLNSLQK
jgi:hypothetical protein